MPYDPKRWPLVWTPFSPVELRERREWPPVPGTVYGAPWLLDPGHAFHRDLHPRWHRAETRPRRLPVGIWLPGHGAWFPDVLGTRDRTEWTMAPAAGPEPGEDVQAWLSRLTLSPSINSVGAYHGWLRDGHLTDDIDGRRYDARGVRTA